MKLKLDPAGNVVVHEGKIVYVSDDGKDLFFDVPSMYSKITTLTQENAATRRRAEEAEANVAKFSGIEDPAAALKAISIVKNLDDKKLVDAGEVQKVKDETAKAYEAKLAERDAKNAALEKSLFGELVGGAFSRSKYLAEKVATPVDLVQARFGNNFRVENGNVYAVDVRGEKLYSATRPGEFATVDEALEMFVSSHPNRDQMLKASGGNGGGALPGAGGGNGGAGGQKQVLRSQFDAMTPQQQAQVGRDANVAIVDG